AGRPDPPLRSRPRGHRDRTDRSAPLRRLTGHLYDLVVEPEDFIVEDDDGPLRAGEPDRAR
ncbi:hypothetical protein ACFWIQ_38380, partial [Kitasatospora sp. NPDC127059]|uniref:hypothetical protein n=1 Tax=unclassified Kitasatospora TaxID=2633591 RepID=UPI003652B1EB